MLPSCGLQLAALALFCSLAVSAATDEDVCPTTNVTYRGRTAVMNYQFNSEVLVPSNVTYTVCPSEYRCYECVQEVDGTIYYGAICTSQMEDQTKSCKEQETCKRRNGIRTESCHQKLMDIQSKKKCPYAQAVNGRIEEGTFDVFCQDGSCAKAVIMGDGSLYQFKSCETATNKWLTEMKQRFPNVGNNFKFCKGDPDATCSLEGTPESAEQFDASDDAGTNLCASHFAVLSLAAMLSLWGAI